mmetsp:Transcript_10445/g.19530  ORF Transcript_10445/g.19530 Transcript_10445/m.19530 type:complete len:789 (-) Transcript_10445:2410-4776(-)
MNNMSSRQAKKLSLLEKDILSKRKSRINVWNVVLCFGIFFVLWQIYSLNVMGERYSKGKPVSDKPILNQLRDSDVSGKYALEKAARKAELRGQGTREDEIVQKKSSFSLDQQHTKTELQDISESRVEMLGSKLNTGRLDDTDEREKTPPSVLDDSKQTESEVNKLIPEQTKLGDVHDDIPGKANENDESPDKNSEQAVDNKLHDQNDEKLVDSNPRGGVGRNDTRPVGDKADGSKFDKPEEDEEEEEDGEEGEEAGGEAVNALNDLDLTSGGYGEGDLKQIEVRPSYLYYVSRVLNSACHVVPTAGVDPNHKQVCCRSKTDHSFRCLPGMIVMGAQKGGTTALHSWLLLVYDLLKASNKKELHMFDSDSNFESIRKKLTGAWEGMESLATSAQVLNYESTPSYIASTMACERMSAVLPPWTTFVLILRDPVKRFWSEINMKRRRVDAQQAMLDSVVKHREKFVECWKNTTSSRCFNELIRGPNRVVTGSFVKLGQLLSKFTQLKKSFKNQTEGALPELMSVCMRNDAFESKLEQRTCFTRHGLFRESNPSLPGVIVPEIERLQSCRDNSYEFRETKFSISGYNVSSEQLTHCEGAIRRTCPFCRQGTPKCVIACLSNTGWANELMHSGCRLPDLSFYPLLHKRMKDAKGCYGGMCKCYPAAKNFADISKNFVWRGMYADQLTHCFQYIPRERMVIVENDELRNDPNGTLNRILRASNLPERDFSGSSFKEASARFKKFYPQFEDVTGWSVNGTSSEMPTYLKDRLKKFYAEPNKRLFKLLGKTYDHWL